MLPYSRFLQALAAIQPLDATLTTALLNYVRAEAWPAHHQLLRPGQVARHVYFLHTGLVRGYTLQNGREASSWFMREGDFMISIASFFTQTPGDEYLELLEPSEGFSLSYEHLQQLYRDFPAFNFHGRVLTEHYYVQSELRARHLRTLPAAERYAQLLHDFPNVQQRVSGRHLASFLGITPETLSRLRAKA